MGYVRHLRDVWSYAKLTTEGLTFDGAEVFRAIEQTLPARFGGRTGDYQLIARQEASGVTRYLLVVSPSVGEVDEASVRQAFLDAMGGAGLILVGRSTDPFHPRAVRAARGTLFTVALSYAPDIGELWRWARAQRVQTVATSAIEAFVIHILVPFSTHPSDVFFAVVIIPPGLDP